VDGEEAGVFFFGGLLQSNHIYGEVHLNEKWFTTAQRTWGKNFDSTTWRVSSEGRECFSSAFLIDPVSTGGVS